ncbi:MAG: hypothetical protein WDO17_22110 [Alphaproteobacteria bacterium]
MNAVFRSPAFRNTILPLGLIVALLAVWEYAKQPFPKPRPQAEDYGPPPPRNANEELFRDARLRRRESTLKTLDANWASFCDPQGRKRLVNSLNDYFYFRDGAEASYPSRWGEVGKAYIAREFSTTDDKRIEQQIRELYARGYLDPKMFGAIASKRVTALVYEIKVERKPCAA